MEPPSRIDSVLETVLYADDLDAAGRFYRDVLALRDGGTLDGLSAVFRVSETQVLLVFNPAESEQPGRLVPSHGTRGPGHVAFRIDPPDYDAWLDRLRDAGVPIEHEQVWPGGVRSFYVRDPAGNSVELITGDIWPDGTTG